MPISPGWSIREAIRTTIGTETSTGSTLVLGLPVGTVNGDILLLALSHKSAAFATVPAGWTLIEREVSGPVRGELYWRRASSEPATYTITGLDTLSKGWIEGYGGGLAVGNVVLASSKVARAGERWGAPSLTATAPRQMLVTFWATSGTYPNSYFNSQWVKTDTTVNNSLDQYWYDSELLSVGLRRWSYSTSPTTLGLFLIDLTKVNPGPVGVPFMGVTASFLTTPNVCIQVLLIPEEGGATPGTRYYLANKTPQMRVRGYIEGTWQTGGEEGPRTYQYHAFPPWQLSQRKVDAGRVRPLNWVRGGGLVNTSGESVLYSRWMTPPLQAQTIGGTFDLVVHCGCLWIQGTTPYAGPDVRTKVHIYISKGQTTEVRQVLVDNYIDSVPWVTGTSTSINATPDTTGRALAAPLALSGTVLAGDSIIIELGAHIVASTTPLSVTLPASNYIKFRMGRGASCANTTAGSSITSSPIGAPDATLGGSYGGVGNSAPFFDFSQTLLEQVEVPLTALPANISRAAAIVLPGDLSTPYQAHFDTRQAAEANRTLWFTHTVTTPGKLIFHTFGSNYSIYPRVYIVTASGLPRYYYDHNYRVELSMTSVQVPLLEVGDVVTISLSAEGFDFFECPACGGYLDVWASYAQPPANDDLIVQDAGTFLRYAGTRLMDMLVTEDTWTGLAIDYSGIPMVDFEADDALTTGHRLLVGYFTSPTSLNGGLIEVMRLDWGPFRFFPEMNYFSDTLSPPSSSVASVSNTVGASGRNAAGYFGNGFQRIAGGGASYQDVLATLGSANINVFNIDDNDMADVIDPSTNYPPILDAGGTSYIEIDQTETWGYYASGGWYVPVGGQKLYRIHLATGVVSLFATIPVGPGPNPGIKGLFPLPDGTVLVCNGGEVVRVSAAGAILHHYVPAETHLAQSLTDVEPTTSGQQFWVWDECNCAFWKFDLLTGAQLLHFETYLGSGSSTSIVVYRKFGFIPPEPPPELSCPAEVFEPVTDGNACPKPLPFD